MYSILCSRLKVILSTVLQNFFCIGKQVTFTCDELNTGPVIWHSVDPQWLQYCSKKILLARYTFPIDCSTKNKRVKQ